MSKVKIQGDASGSGIFTIAAPNSSTDRTLTLPDEAGTVLTSAGAGTDYLTPTGDGSGLTGISSYADSDALSLFNASGSAPVYACRAWVNFNGTGTVAIRESGNVSSITDNGGNGNYTVNFTTAMPDANYATVCGPHDWTTMGPDVDSGSTYSTSAVQVIVRNPTTAVGLDRSYCSVTIFR